MNAEVAHLVGRGHDPAKIKTGEPGKTAGDPGHFMCSSYADEIHNYPG